MIRTTPTDAIAPSSNPPSLDAIADRRFLLRAVKARLAVSVAEWRAAALQPQWHDKAAHAHAAVLECVAALDQVQAEMEAELGRCRQLESEVLEVRSALARVQDEAMRARHLALHDGLTSLPNRDFFRSRLDHVVAHAAARGQSVAVLYIDLDGFKPINDSHGHDVGDEVLRIVGTRLSRSVRSEDMVSRVGGDEFACLLANLPSREHLSHLACKLLDTVSAPLTIGPVELTVRPSIGIATWPADGATPDALLKNADAAMYRAKQQKRGYAFFDECVEA